MSPASCCHLLSNSSGASIPSEECRRRRLYQVSSHVLRHIHVGRAHKGARIRLLIAGTDVRIIREDGALLRKLTLDAERLYFGKPRPVHNVVRQVSSMS